MTNILEYIYTVFTRIFDFLSWGWDLLNNGIDFISQSFSWIVSMVQVFPTSLQVSFTLLIILAVLCLVFHR